MMTDEEKKQRKEMSRKWKEDNRERKLKYGREWAKANLEKGRNWAKNNAGKILAKNTSRRAKKNLVENTLTATEWIEIVLSYGSRCVYCNKVCKPTQDHVVPISAGGAHTKENVVPACQTCNSSKGKKPLIFWMAQKAGFVNV